MPRCSSGGLENIQLDGGASPSKNKKARVNWSEKEDNLLISAWLNFLKDPIDETGPKSEGFWKRITSYYNDIRDEMPPRAPKQLKDHWHIMKHAVFKFVRCYDIVVERKQSMCSESEVFSDALALYKYEYGVSFTLEHAWRLLRDEPKWRDVAKEYCSKRTKVSESGAYTSSSNMEMPTSLNPSAPPLECISDQNAADSKSKATEEARLGTAGAYMSSSNLETPTSRDTSAPPLKCLMDESAAMSKSKATNEAGRGTTISRFELMRETAERKIAILEQLALAKQEETLAKQKEARAKQEEARAKQEEARAKQEEARAKQEEARALAEEARIKQQVLEYEILMKDTSEMTASQQRDHDRICELIRKKVFGV